MPKLRIHYFSSTGNTARAVNLFQREVEKNGYTTELRFITTEGPANEPGLSQELIAFPALGFSAPVMVKKYLKALPRGEGRNMSVLCINAGGATQAVWQVEKMLKRRGYKVTLTASIASINNWVQFFTTADSENIKKLLDKSDLKVKEFALAYLENKSDFHRPDFLTSLWSGFVSRMFGLVGRRILGKAYIADSSCTSCGYCARTCPGNTIKMDAKLKRPLWKANCQDCNRCMNLCPAQAIQTSTLRLKINFISYFIFSLVSIAAGIFIGLWVSSTFPWYIGMTTGVSAFALVSILTTLFQFTVLDSAMTSLQQKVFPKAFEKSFTKDFRRYCAPDFKPASLR